MPRGVVVEGLRLRVVRRGGGVSGGRVMRRWRVS